MPDLHNHDSFSHGDALFLYLERHGSPMNVASVMVFDGVIPLEVCRDFIASKLPLIPRYRQHIVTPPLNLGLPVWEYDPAFDIRNHIREVKLRHGTEAELKSTASKILSDNLDRSRPLWDFTLLQGLKGNSTGVVIRIHHCLADGVSGIALMNVLLDASPTVAPLANNQQQFDPPPPRDPASVLLDGIVQSCFSAVERVLTVQSELLKVAQRVVAAMAGQQAPSPLQSGYASELPAPALNEITRLLPELAMTTQRLPFNVLCRGPQKFNWAEIPLAEIKAVKNVCGTTVNDVALAVVTAAIRRYAELHGVDVAGRLLRIVVPVNVRGNGDVGQLGNRITFLPVSIPLGIRDPRELLMAVRDRMQFLKTMHLAELVGVAGTLLGTIPPSVQALLGPLAAQLPISVCNTICTNVPGPQIPLYLIGHKLQRFYPYVPIGGEMGMNCAVVTYDGTAYFGFTGDAHAIPDLERLPKFLMESFAELRQASGVRAQRRKRVQPKREAATVEVQETPLAVQVAVGKEKSASTEAVIAGATEPAQPQEQRSGAAA